MKRVFSKKLFSFIILEFVFLGCIYGESPEDSFIISKSDTKRTAKSELKENVAEQIKDTLHYCAELSKQIGKIQIELSDMQRQLFEKVEELVDNNHPFKKAKRLDLGDAINVMRNVNGELANQLQVVKKITMQMNKNNCLRKKTG